MANLDYFVDVFKDDCEWIMLFGKEPGRGFNCSSVENFSLEEQPVKEAAERLRKFLGTLTLASDIPGLFSIHQRESTAINSSTHIVSSVRLKTPGESFQISGCLVGDATHTCKHKIDMLINDIRNAIQSDENRKHFTPGTIAS